MLVKDPAYFVKGFDNRVAGIGLFVESLAFGSCFVGAFIEFEVGGVVAATILLFKYLKIDRSLHVVATVVVNAYIHIAMREKILEQAGWNSK